MPPGERASGLLVEPANQECHSNGFQHKRSHQAGEVPPNRPQAAAPLDCRPTDAKSKDAAEHDERESHVVVDAGMGIEPTEIGGQQHESQDEEDDPHAQEQLHSGIERRRPPQHVGQQGRRTSKNQGSGDSQASSGMDVDQQPTGGHHRPQQGSQAELSGSQPAVRRVYLGLRFRRVGSVRAVGHAEER